MNLLYRDRCFIIAEAGTCHADTDQARAFRRAIDYVHAARDAGADAVKFQWFAPVERLFCPYDGDARRFPRWDASAMNPDYWARVKETAEGCGLVFLASAFQYATVKWLTALGVTATKVASRATATFPYSEAPKPYLISLGMAEPPDIDGAVLIECESRYPSTLRWKGEHPGFSDHSGHPWRAVDAIARGCRLVEVHYFIDPRDAGPDLPASLNQADLAIVCKARDAFAAFSKEQP